MRWPASCGGQSRNSYCQKAKAGFYENGINFETRMLDGSEPVASEFATLWPIGRFPIVKDGEELVFEATSIIEYLDARFPDTPRLVPADPLAAVEVRMWDRFFDNYINYPQQRMVYAAIGREPDDGAGGAKWKAAFDVAYALFDARMVGREWVAGEFSLVDCAAAPSLLYADWTYPIPPALWASLVLSRTAASTAQLRPGAQQGTPLSAHVPLGRTVGSGLRYNFFRPTASTRRLSALRDGAVTYLSAARRCYARDDHRRAARATFRNRLSR